MATSLTQISSTSTSITVRVRNWPSGTGFIRFYIGTNTSNMPMDGYRDVGSSTYCDYTFSGLEPDTAYYIKISPRAATTGQEATESATTVLMYTDSAFDPPSIGISQQSSTSNSVTYAVEIYAPSAGTFQVEFYIAYLGTYQSHLSYGFPLSDYGSTVLSWEFTGIPSKTSVTAYAFLYDYSTGEQYAYCDTTIVTKGPVWPGDWNWTSNVRQGAQMPYTRSGNVITCTPLTAAEWNGFVNRVIQIREDLEFPANNLEALYVYRGSPFNADVVEAMRQVLDGMNPPTPVPAVISSGAVITALSINGLKASLNSFRLMYT